MLVTNKTIEKLGRSINESSGSKVSSFALKQMQKYGWSEGKGLGKNEDGMKKHIKIRKIEENAGIGKEKAVSEALSEEWWHDSFDVALQKMSKKAKRKDSSDGKVTSRTPPTYEELYLATGGAQLGMRARADQQGKWKRTSLSDVVEESAVAVHPIVEQETKKLKKRKKV